MIQSLLSVAHDGGRGSAAVWASLYVLGFHNGVTYFCVHVSVRENKKTRVTVTETTLLWDYSGY